MAEMIVGEEARGLETGFDEGTGRLTGRGRSRDWAIEKQNL